MPIRRELIQPRAEGEIAFLLERDLVGPGVTPADVIAATECVMPCFEVVDSRIRDWKIRVEDTVADNASSGLFALGRETRPPSGFDFFSCGMVVEKNGEIVSTGAGAAALGSPLVCVAWLANTLGGYRRPAPRGGRDPLRLARPARARPARRPHAGHHRGPGLGLGRLHLSAQRRLVA